MALGGCLIKFKCFVLFCFVFLLKINSRKVDPHFQIYILSFIFLPRFWFLISQIELLGIYWGLNRKIPFKTVQFGELGGPELSINNRLKMADQLRTKESRPGWFRK